MDTLLVHCFRSRWVSAFALAAVVLSFVLPAQGFGVPMCHFKSLTQLPCLGCGLTRSFIGMAHLHVTEAGFYHPVGVLLFPLVMWMALLLFAPGHVRERCARWVAGRPRLVNFASAALLAFFLVYGFGRIFYCLWLQRIQQPIPW